MFACSSADRYLLTNVNKFCFKIDHTCYLLDDGVFKTAQYGATLAGRFAKIRNDGAAVEKCDSVASAFETGRTVISASRLPFALNKWFTGQAIWQKNERGWRYVVADKEGRPKPITKEELTLSWTKQSGGGWRHNTTAQISSDGIYIDAREGEGCRLTRNWVDIVMDVLILAARCIAPVRLLHHLKAYDLGHHAAKSLSKTTFGLWFAVLFVGALQAGDNYLNETDRSNLPKLGWETFQATIDVIALPFDFGIGNAHIAIAIVGAFLNLISALSLVAKEAYYYE